MEPVVVVYYGAESAAVTELRRRFQFVPAGTAAHVVAESDSVAAACQLAVEHPELVNSLVLIAPTADVERLGEINVPTLIVCGTADEASVSMSARYKRRMPDSYRLLIYGAGRDIAADACTRLVAVVEDFLKRGEAFVVAS